MKKNLSKLLLFTAFIALQGCGENTGKTAPKTAPSPQTAPTAQTAPVAQTAPATPPVAAVPAKTEAPIAAAPATTPVATAPIAAAEAPKPNVGATSLDDFNPATDPILGWWKPELDRSDDEKVSFLWPTEATDTRAVRTIRFLNDGMATNGCCAGATWTFAAPKFYKLDREIHELYYLADNDTLYFLVRTDAAKSEELFKKIIAEVTAKKSLTPLTESNLIDTPVKFTRTQIR